MLFLLPQGFRLNLSVSLNHHFVVHLLVAYELLLNQLKAVTNVTNDSKLLNGSVCLSDELETLGLFCMSGCLGSVTSVFFSCQEEDALEEVCQQIVKQWTDCCSRSAGAGSHPDGRCRLIVINQNVQMFPSQCSGSRKQMDQNSDQSHFENFIQICPTALTLHFNNRR